MISAGKLSVMASVILLLLTMSLILSIFKWSAADVRAGIPLSEVQYKVVEIKYGDTLWSIAEEQFKNNRQTASSYKGVRSYMKEVISLNDLNDGNYLLAGQKLIVPYYSSDYKS